jgi:hypothetical protein
VGQGRHPERQARRHRHGLRDLHRVADCQAGTYGTLGGELNEQGGGNIAADADGAVYEADWNTSLLCAPCTKTLLP